MLLPPSRFRPRLAGVALLLLVATAPSRAADDEKIFTQQPELLTGQDAAKPAAPRPVSQLFTAGPAPAWIWGDDTSRRYFLRKEFPGGSRTARLRATCDNQMTITLNGRVVAQSDDWNAPVEANVQKQIKPGTNVLLVEVKNDGGPAGFILKLALTDADGKTRHVVSDESWQAAEKRDADRWMPAKKIAGLGEGAWGDVFTRTGSAAPTPTPFHTPPGFVVERLFTVPRERLGSWVSITFDNKGRLLASDQEGKGLCRITPPAPGSSEPTKVERLDVPISAAQGMLYAFGSLYLSVNGGPGSGLYRLRDTKGTDQFDEVVKLASFRGGGEHGPHGLRLSPDGRSILVVCGNHTDPPPTIHASRIPTNWNEDHLLPRQWDANGHARGRLAPGGWIARTDPDGKRWEIVSIGYRNAYDIALNAEGELFAYDSDMEWDMGTPWYRPTRVTHATSGSEFGWRSGTGKWPASYADSLPPLLDIGPGSPVGVEFGYGTRFPAKYQKALYICDWTFGTMYALHLEPDGSTYRAVKEEFVSRTPLPLTDVTVGPDGALYFTIGGRGTQSELFRVRYVGKEPTAPADLREPRGAELRALRRQIEAYHAPAADGRKAVEFVYRYLGHPDRFIRYAARVALEHQKIDLWRDRVLAETDPEALLNGAIALARQGDRSVQPRLLEALGRLDLAALPEFQGLELLRAYSLAFIRLGEPDAATASRLVARLDPLFPAKTDALNRELCALLVYLKSPTVVAKTIDLLKKETKASVSIAHAELLARNQGYGGTIARLQANAPDLQKLHYVFVLRNARDGWTMDHRTVYFRWLEEARGKSGGASYLGFLNNIERDAFDNATDAERLAIEAAGLRKPYRPKELPKPIGPGRDWKLTEVVAFAEPRLKGRNFKNGERAFAAARCVVCHRFGGDGGATGPDLTQAAGRFTLRDLCESMIEPSKVVSDQYRASVVTTESGKVYTGRIVNETKDGYVLVIDPEDSTKVIELKKKDVESVKPSTVSLMPQDLLKTLNENEVLDLLAYLLSRGDPGHPMFKK